ncbi:MAG: response regulator [Desulfobacterales bacterium]|nr:response regulator [Desulfobacterales bacterium]
MKRAIFRAFCVFFLCIFISWVTIDWYENQLIEKKHYDIVDDLSVRASSLSIAINQRFSLLKGLKVFLDTMLKMEISIDKVFEPFAEGLYQGSRGICNFVIAPDGVNKYIYPRGKNTFPLSSYKFDTIKAMQIGKIVLSGPHEHKEGLFAIAIQPIYYKEKFWGLISIDIDLPVIFEELKTSHESIALAIRDKSGKIFYGSRHVFENNPVLLDIPMPDGTNWKLGAIPEEGWNASIRMNIIPFYFLCFGISILLSILTYALSYQHTHLKILLDEQTKEIKESLNAVQQSQKQYVSLFESMQSGFVLCQIIRDENNVPIDYSFIQVNSAFEMQTGLKREDIIGKRAQEIFPNVDPYWVQIYGKVAMTGDPAEFIRYFEDIKKHFSIKAFCPELGKFAGILIDITKEKEMEIELTKKEAERNKFEKLLNQAQKMEAIGTLAGGIAHDFNNILVPIIGYTQLIMAQTKDNNELQISLKEILQASLRAKDLVKHILTFSRQSNVEHNLISLQQIINEAVKLIRSSLPSTIKIDCKIDKKCGSVLGNLTQIHQIIMNLCTNAYHAMEEKGGLLEVVLNEVDVDSQLKDIEQGRYACLTIKDNGCGMTHEVMSRIFDPYFTTKKQGKGTGLGLAVVHGIVKNHGGNIVAQSEPMKGSVFKVYFPIAQDISKQDKVVLPQIIHRGKEHILLVDDEEAVAKIEKKTLESLGYRVTIKKDGIEGLEIFQSSPNEFDLIITDMTMPIMCGDKFAQKAIKIKPNIPIILCTGYSELMDEEKAISIGIKAYVMKPMIAQEIAFKIREVLESK